MNILFFICLMFLSVTVCYGSDNSVFITAIQNEQTHALAKEVVREAYRRIGYDVKIAFLPGQRSLEMANKGKSDGDVARIEGTERKFSNLIPVPQPVIWFEGVAFSKNITRKINKWNDLKGLHIGIIRGIRYSEIGTEALSPYYAEDMTHLFKLLDRDRIQVAIAVLRAGKIEISRNFRYSGIRVVSKPLFSAPLYHFVHKKNRHLVSRLNNVLQEMEKQGETLKIIEAVFSSLLIRNNGPQSTADDE